MSLGITGQAKNSLFSLEERVSMIKEMTKDMPNVKVASFDGLLVDFMNEIDATVLSAQVFRRTRSRISSP